MGRYLPVIKTAECGSLTRAAHVLGYTQPSLGYIINNIEDELGIKLFYRDQRGVTLTEAGAPLLEVMKKIEAMEDHLRQMARAGAGGLLRVGIFPSVASQWLPAILREFYEKHPGALVKLSHQFYYLNGEIGVKDHSLDCAFFTGKCPPGLEAVALYQDPYYLVVSADHPLAGQDSVALSSLTGAERFIPTNESFDSESAIWDVYQTFSQSNLVDFEPRENQTCIAMVESGLGVTILPGLSLYDLLPGRRVKAIPLKEDVTRTISLLCPPKEERSAVTSAFLQLVQRQVVAWEEEHREWGLEGTP